jgi:hypothetical protein
MEGQIYTVWSYAVLYPSKILMVIFYGVNCGYFDNVQQSIELLLVNYEGHFTHEPKAMTMKL